MLHFWVNLVLQKSHLKGLTPKCSCLCTANELTFANVLLHFSHVSSDFPASTLGFAGKALALSFDFPTAATAP